MSERESIQQRIADTDIDTVVHWGAQVFWPNGRVRTTRWASPCGPVDNEPYTEEEARAEVRRSEGGLTKRLVTRTETTVTTTLTTPWEVVE